MIYAKSSDGYTKIDKLLAAYVGKDTLTILGDVAPIEYSKPDNWDQDKTGLLIAELERAITTDFSKMRFIDPQKLINLIAEQHTDKNNNDIKIEVVSH